MKNRVDVIKCGIHRRHCKIFCKRRVSWFYKKRCNSSHTCDIFYYLPATGADDKRAIQRSELFLDLLSRLILDVEYGIFLFSIFLRMRLCRYVQNRMLFLDFWLPQSIREDVGHFIRCLPWPWPSRGQPAISRRIIKSSGFIVQCKQRENK